MSKNIKKKMSKNIQQHPIYSIICAKEYLKNV